MNDNIPCSNLFSSLPTSKDNLVTGDGDHGNNHNQEGTKIQRG